jgi:hypothetical protein
MVKRNQNIGPVELQEWEKKYQLLGKKLARLIGETIVYSGEENVVLWARSSFNGFANRKGSRRRDRKNIKNLFYHVP